MTIGVIVSSDPLPGLLTLACLITAERALRKSAYSIICDSFVGRAPEDMRLRPRSLLKR